MKEEPITYCARDSKGRWCAFMLNERKAGTRWLLLDEGLQPEETVAIAMFVFTGEGPPHMLSRVRLIPNSVPRDTDLFTDLERAVSLDDLFPVPDWIRKATA